MRSLAYVLLILGASAVDLASDMKVQDAHDQRVWNITMTVLVLIGIVMLIREHKDGTQ